MKSKLKKVAIIMGSNSDWPVMKHAADTLDFFGIAYEAKVVSAHRTPDLMFDFAESSNNNGISLIIAGAGGAAHLPGMVASKSRLPVLGVPIPTKYLNGQDSLYSIVQMPKGIPVATFAIGEAGAANAALFAVSMFAQDDNDLLDKLKKFRADQEIKVKEMKLKED
ncbi:MAG: 5-(carboxyamino)imidazole ribonucleotide mutase [Methylophilaceae bacterium]|jgi:5-(carboxyamino)imidazole ribonucleotide mutase|nr:5-(carboxyamino)imidazole ribonucleotide mutase [Methylophilaceae bacterium]